MSAADDPLLGLVLEIERNVNGLEARTGYLARRQLEELLSDPVLSERRSPELAAVLDTALAASRAGDCLSDWVSAHRLASSAWRRSTAGAAPDKPLSHWSPRDQHIVED